MAVKEAPDVWALYFDVDDNGLQDKVQGKRIVEVELSRRERRKTFDDKDDKSSRSLSHDEENALPPGEQRQDDLTPDSKNAQSSEAKEQDVIPNGGLTAWLQVLGSFLLFFNTFGILK